MKKSLRKSLTALLVWIILCLGGVLLFIDVPKAVFTKENISGAISKLDINKILFGDALQGHNSGLIRGDYPYMEMSQKDVEKIFSSEEYANILGEFLADSGISIDKNGDMEQNLDGISKEDIRVMLDKNGIPYTDHDVSYVCDSAKYLVPQLFESSNEELSKTKATSIFKVFDKKNINKAVVSYVILIVVACVSIVLLQSEKFYFFILFGGCSAGIGGLSLVMSKLCSTLLKADWKDFEIVKEHLIQPLQAQFFRDGIIALIIGIVLFGLYALFNFTVLKDVTPRSLDEVSKMFKKTNDMDAIGVELKLPSDFDTSGELKEPANLSVVEIVDYDKKFAEFDNKKSKGI